MKSYDIIVIGSGGGSKITRPAANMGYKVAIIEKGRLGGTCLNHGCIPSKMLIHPADMIAEIRDADRFQLDVNQNIHVRFKELVERVSATIDADSDSIAPAYEKHPNIDFYPHKAVFTGAHSLEVNGEQITAKKIIVTAGCRASIPPIPGLKDTPYLTYKEALRHTTLPKKLTIIGGGFIALELGFFFGMMGSEVTFILRSGLLHNEDKDIAEEFKRNFSQRFTIIEHATFNAIRHNTDQFNVDITVNGNNQLITSDQLLVAAGVTPNTDILDCQKAGINLDEKGFIKVNNHMETSTAGVYAFGDIIGKHMFRHAANFEGEYVFFRHIQNSHSNPLNYKAMPSAVFTNPQIAKVGLTENDCHHNNIPYIKGVNSYKASAMGMALQSENGFVKLLFHKETTKLIGAQIIGYEASTMIHTCMAFLHMDAAIQDMLDMIYIHPALPEIVRNAARNAAREFNA